MADSTVTDFNKMKVVELRKELKTRGLSHNGDKSELVARLQAAVTQEEQDHADITLDSDEIDSDGVLEDEDEKSQSELTLEESIVNDTINEDIALSESPAKEITPVAKPQRTLKRKLTNSDNTKLDKPTEAKESSKKIVLNRAASITSLPSNPAPAEEKQEINSNTDTDKVKITPVVDSKSKLELRAKRFGIPVDMSELDRKEARKIRFGQNSSSTGTTTTTSSAPLAENLEKLKKRAERFGQSVSKVMTDLENREKLEKRKAKFGVAK